MKKSRGIFISSAILFLATWIVLSVGALVAEPSQPAEKRLGADEERVSKEQCMYQVLTAGSRNSRKQAINSIVRQSFPPGRYRESFDVSVWGSYIDYLVEYGLDSESADGIVEALSDPEMASNMMIPFLPVDRDGSIELVRKSGALRLYRLETTASVIRGTQGDFYHLCKWNSTEAHIESSPSLQEVMDHTYLRFTLPDARATSATLTLERADDGAIVIRTPTPVVMLSVEPRLGGEGVRFVHTRRFVDDASELEVKKK